MGLIQLKHQRLVSIHLRVKILIFTTMYSHTLPLYLRSLVNGIFDIICTSEYLLFFSLSVAERTVQSMNPNPGPFTRLRAYGSPRVTTVCILLVFKGNE